MRAKPVKQYDLNGQYIACYPTIEAAAKAVSGYSVLIQRCCKKLVDNAFGFIWRFACLG